MKRSTLTDFGTTEGSDPVDDRTDGSTRPVSTFAVGQEVPCSACERVSDRLWRTEDGFVCPSCVSW